MAQGCKHKYIPLHKFVDGGPSSRSLVRLRRLCSYPASSAVIMAEELQALASSINQLFAGMQTQQQKHEQQDNLVTNLVNAMNQHLQHQAAVTSVIARAVTGASATPPSAAKWQLSLVDTRGISRPKPFTGAVDGWMVWRYKMMSFINAAAPDFGGSLDWAENQKEEVDQELIQQLCNTVGTDTAARDAFAKELHSAITRFVEGEPLRTVMGSTNGFATWRLLLKRYHPRSSGTKRQTLTKMLTLTTCKTFTELDAAMLKMAWVIREYDRASTQVLVDEIKAKSLVNTCPCEVKENIGDGITKGFTYTRNEASVAGRISRKNERDANR